MAQTLATKQLGSTSKKVTIKLKKNVEQDSLEPVAENNKENAEEGLPPKIPVPKKHVTNNVRVFNDNVVLMNPFTDASDKEIYLRNGFINAGKNLVGFLKNEGNTQKQDVFKPKSLGEFTKDNLGTTISITGKDKKPKFHKVGFVSTYGDQN